MADEGVRIEVEDEAEPVRARTPEPQPEAGTEELDALKRALIFELRSDARWR